MFIKYEAEVSTSVGGGERGVVDFDYSTYLARSASLRTNVQSKWGV